MVKFFFIGWLMVMVSSNPLSVARAVHNSIQNKIYYIGRIINLSIASATTLIIILITTIILVACNSSSGKGHSTDSKEGIRFSSSTLEQVAAQSKQENKLGSCWCLHAIAQPLKNEEVRFS